MIAVLELASLNDFGNRLFRSLWPPAGEGRIAESAAQITPGGAHKNALRAGQHTLALDRFIQFTYEQNRYSSGPPL